MDVRLLFPTLYLGAPDFRGKPATLTIERVQQEELRTTGGTETKLVIYFRECREKAKDPEKQKRLVANKTNAMTIAALHGYEIDNWPGKRVTLYPTTCQAFGDTVDCIRVSTDMPQGGNSSTQVVQMDVATAGAGTMSIQDVQETF
jgi:hypothetical protein